MGGKTVKKRKMDKNFKVDNTIELASMVSKMRKNNFVDGKPLTAHELSLKMGKNRAWVSQLESRRLKKVKYSDIIKLYKILLSYDTETAEKEFDDYYNSILNDQILNCVLNDFSEVIHNKYSFLGLKGREKLIELIKGIEKYLNFNNNLDLNTIAENLNLAAINSLFKHDSFAHTDCLSFSTEIYDKESDMLYIVKIKPKNNKRGDTDET